MHKIGSKRLLFACLCGTLAVLGFFVPSATAGDGQAGACLLFPYFNTKPDNITIFRISNISNETVRVRLVVVDEETCSIHDRWLSLTGNDTCCFLGSWMTHQPMRGFLYAHIEESEAAGQEEAANVLIGQELIFGSWDPGVMMSFSLNASSFKALDVDPDDQVHLDGAEYEPAPKTLFFPGFLGQNFPDAFQPAVEGRVLLINLTGGMYFWQSADLLIYNDNEQAFSGHVDFPCFAVMKLTQLSGATRNSFLQSTSHDLDEPKDLTHLDLETGWLSITGKQAVNPGTGFYIDHASLSLTTITLSGFRREGWNNLVQLG